MSAFPSSRTWRAAALAGVAAGALILTGCSGGALGGGSSPSGSGAASGDTGSTIKIGYVSPETGSLAPFGADDKYVIDSMTTYFQSHPVVTADGVSHPVQIIVKDTQSDSKTASSVAQDLILNDQVSLILVGATPDTTNPVSDQCEANHVLCISSVAPWQSWFFGRGGKDGTAFNWTYHFFWGLEDVEKVYSTIWKAVDPTATNVGLLLGNDTDATAWRDTSTGLPPFVKSLSMTPDDPGAFTDGATDFSAQISKFKQNNDTILAGNTIPPDMITFWKQAVQQGYNPKVVTMAKSMLFPSSVEALGKIANNISTEVWWTPTYPYSSSLTGQSAQQLADAFTKSTGQPWSQPLGFDEAMFEVAVKDLESAASLNESDLAAAMKTMKVDTIAGSLDWTSGPEANVAKTPLTGGQWRQDASGNWQLIIVANPDHPNIPLGGKPEAINWSGQ